MKLHPTHSPARAGFTLIEVVLAMFVLLIGMTSILGLLSFGAAMSRTAGLRAGAANAIEAVVTDLEETFFPLELDANGDEVAGAPRAIKDRPVPGYPGLVYTTTATANPDDPREYRVDVEITWAEGGTQRSKRFTTLLLREVPFGERLRARFIEKRTLVKPVADAAVGTSKDRKAGAKTDVKTDDMTDHGKATK